MTLEHGGMVDLQWSRILAQHGGCVDTAMVYRGRVQNGMVVIEERGRLSRRGRLSPSNR